MSMGSFWTGIKGVTWVSLLKIYLRHLLSCICRLSSSTGKPSTSTINSLAARSGSTTAIEASVIFEYNDYYYLFTSWDACCQGTSSTYNIRVGRSKRYVPISILVLGKVDFQ